MTRWAVRIAVFLLLGAIVNVAVAWGVVLGRPALILSPGGGWHLAPAAMWKTSAPAEYPRTPLRSEMTRTFGCEILVATGKRSRSDPSNLSIEQRRYGWPMLAVDCTCWKDAAVPTGTWTHRNGLALSGDANTPARILPLRLRWPGFAINTVLYAAVLCGAWMVFAMLPLALRRCRRMKHGLCPKCGYDLRGRATDAASCPECGEVSVTPMRHRTNV